MFEWQTGKSPGKERFRNYFPSFLRTFADLIYGVVVEGKNAQKLDSNHLREVVLENTGYHTFQEAFDRTGRIINITVAPVNDFDPPRLLNYLTAPHVCIYSAALASCAIPGEDLDTSCSSALTARQASSTMLP
jgi:TAG lipase / steryl ester hydrolase / phospholipase A2 / LPA acyltransferase